VFVLTATSLATVLIYAGITTYAAAKSAEVPPPDPAYFAQPVYPAPAPQNTYATGTYSEPAPQASGTLRRCPATGCTATTCHAETGEPPPRW
jgi:hypothetical protein